MYKVIISIGLVFPTLLIYLIKRRHKSKMKQLRRKQQSNYYYHCIFLSPSNYICRSHIIEKNPCGDNCSALYYDRIKTFLSSAQYSISMCMYMTTLREISMELIKARDRGVNIRIITDAVMLKNKANSFRYLKYRHGFQIKVPEASDTLMHHKFFLVDEKHPPLAKMMNGSLNLTMQGFVNNFDFIVFTNDAHVIQRYSEEFEELWQNTTTRTFTNEFAMKSLRSNR